jgi:hypothetical protein
VLKISEGPKIRAYAIAVKATVKEVLEWINSQINDPHPEYAKTYPTEKERRDAMLGYITWVLDYDLAEGINERIKRSIENAKIQAANGTEVSA